MIRKLTMSVGALSVVLISAATASAKPPAKADPAKRGEYLVMVGGCNDCHTPMKMTPLGPMPDMERMLSGHPEGQPDPSGTLGKGDLVTTGPDLTSFKFPFGINYARNLTPDKTGLGEWTEAQFIKTLRTGRHQGEGRALLPPMPWFDFGGMTDEDLKAVWAFLRTIKPIKNTVPDPKVPPPVLEQFLKNNAAIADIVINHKAPPAPPPGAAPAAPAAAAPTAPAGAPAAPAPAKK
jgi:hypothetical protein